MKHRHVIVSFLSPLWIFQSAQCPLTYLPPSKPDLLLILRNDAQNLISLRNDNLASLEDRSPSTSPSSDSAEGAAGARPALLACINEAIIAATRSITELGPFLEKHRWPASPAAPPLPDRRSLVAGLKTPHSLLRRARRSKSFTGPVPPPNEQQQDDRNAEVPPPTAEELFTWTLALTAQHTGVLVATDRLKRFLEDGVSPVGEEEVRRREGRASWWAQGRGEFENVELIQSLLAPRPRRKLGDASKEAQGVMVVQETEVVAIPSEQTDADTILSTPRSHPSVSSVHGGGDGGLSVRPRRIVHDNGEVENITADEPFYVRRVVTEPFLPTTSEAPTKTSPLARMETFGQAQSPLLPLSRYNSTKQRPRVATQPLLPLVGLETLPEPNPISRPATAGADGGGVETTEVPHRMLTPLLTTTPSQMPQRPVSCGAESLYTPYTPYSPHTSMDKRMMELFAARALPSKTIQPVIEELDNMIVSPVESQAPQIASPSTTVFGVSPVESLAQQKNQSQLEAADVIVDNEGHKPYLEYIARKQAMSASRWSLRRSKTSEVEFGG